MKGHLELVHTFVATTQETLHLGLLHPTLVKRPSRLHTRLSKLMTRSMPCMHKRVTRSLTVATAFSNQTYIVLSAWHGGFTARRISSLCLPVPSCLVSQYKVNQRSFVLH